MGLLGYLPMVSPVAFLLQMWWQWFLPHAVFCSCNNQFNNSVSFTHAAKQEKLAAWGFYFVTWFILSCFLDCKMVSRTKWNYIACLLHTCFAGTEWPETESWIAILLHCKYYWYGFMHCRTFICGVPSSMSDTLLCSVDRRLNLGSSFLYWILLELLSE